MMNLIRRNLVNLSKLKMMRMRRKLPRKKLDLPRQKLRTQDHKILQLMRPETSTKRKQLRRRLLKLRKKRPTKKRLIERPKKIEKLRLSLQSTHHVMLLAESAGLQTCQPNISRCKWPLTT